MVISYWSIRPSHIPLHFFHVAWSHFGISLKKRKQLYQVIWQQMMKNPRCHTLKGTVTVQCDLHGLDNKLCECFLCRGGPDRDGRRRVLPGSLEQPVEALTWSLIKAQCGSGLRCPPLTWRSSKEARLQIILWPYGAQAVHNTCQNARNIMWTERHLSEILSSIFL